MPSKPRRLLLIPDLCRSDRNLLSSWIEGSRLDSLGICSILIILGCGTYGFAIGFRNGWEMAGWVSLKLPAIIFLTLCLNALLNGMLGLVLGSGIGFRQSLQFLLTGFAIMSLIVGALSPVTLFATLNMPEPGAEGSRTWHGLNLLLHTAIIAFAGTLAHWRLLHYVRDFANSTRAGTLTFCAWLAGNLFVGAQVSWNLRPFFISPGLEVEFLRSDPFDGSFYEAVFHAFRNITPL